MHDVPANMYKVNIDSIVSGPTMFAEKMKNLDMLTDEAGYNIIKENYQIFLSSAIDSQCFEEIRKSSKFITLLTQVCIDVDLTYEERVYCNSMLYQELSKTDSKYMQKLYYMLGFIVNKDMVNKIMACGIGQALSTYFAINRKSSFDPKDNISRLNLCIMCANPELMTVQKITDIYCAIFNTVSEVNDLFQLTIMDTYVFQSDEDWITPDVVHVATNMNFAVISILDSLPFPSLEHILRDYYNMTVIQDIDESDIRFSFKNIDRIKFTNLGLALSKLEEQGIVLP